MVKKQVILAKTGSFGSAENTQNITSQDLQQIVKNFKGNVPITLDLKGHPKGEVLNYPKFGEVSNIWIENNILYGLLSLQPILASAIDNGYYNSWSIGAKLNADNEFYLHHLALLGEMPPSVKEVRETILKELEIPQNELNLSDFENDIIFEFKNNTDTDIYKNKLKEIERKELENSLLGKVPSCYIDRVLTLADSVKCELMLADETGEARPVSIYKELSDIFKTCKNLVEFGESPLMQEKNIPVRNNKNILNKA